MIRTTAIVFHELDWQMQPQYGIHCTNNLANNMSMQLLSEWIMHARLLHSFLAFPLHFKYQYDGFLSTTIFMLCYVVNDCITHMRYANKINNNSNNNNNSGGCLAQK